MHVAARKRCLGALDGGCVSAARLVVVDLSKLDLRSYAGAEHADAAWVRPASPSGRLGPRKVAAVLIWFWPRPPLGVRTAGAGGNGGSSCG